MTFCNGTNGLDLSNLTPEELRGLVPLIDDKAFEYIKKMVLIETDDLILVLDYVNININQPNQFLWDDHSKQQVVTALIAHGGQQISTTPTCFQFATSGDLRLAKAPLKNAIPWAFNHSLAYAQYINANFQPLIPAVQTPPKIRTDVISFYSYQSHRLFLDQDTRFFED